jgi:hypothetical protein
VCCLAAGSVCSIVGVISDPLSETSPHCHPYKAGEIYTGIQERKGAAIVQSGNNYDGLPERWVSIPGQESVVGITTS